MAVQEHYFSKISDSYARFRPNYPTELIDFVCSTVGDLRLAWDCATGNGQVAVSLAERFERVLATDISHQQIANAFPHPRVNFHVSSAENSGIPDASVDLVVVAEALHWFNIPRFYRELERVLKPGGVFVCWNYRDSHIPGPVDDLIKQLRDITLKPFWPREATLVNVSGYPMPETFLEQSVPTFIMMHDWNLFKFTGYINSWSAVSRYRQQGGEQDMMDILSSIERHWGMVEEKKTVSWPLELRLARKN